MCCRTIKLLLLSLCSLSVTQLYAEPATTPVPGPGPITIEADQMQFDERAGSSSYSGHVLLLQDSLRIQADLLSVESKDGRVEKLIATGEPVSFQQQAVASNPALDGEALRIEYHAIERKIYLLDKARLRQGGSEFSGDRIEYDVDKQTISAKAIDTTPERVRVTIVPEQAQEAQPAATEKTLPDPTNINESTKP